MTSFDMVPREYRLRLAMNRWLYRLGAIVAAAIVISMASGAALAFASNSLDSRIQKLQAQHALTNQQLAQLETLDARIAELRRQWQILTMLRSGAPVEKLFTIIDEALDEEPVWFQSWHFIRDGANERRAGVSDDSFFTRSDAQEAGQETAWQIDTHIRINGQALDHAALSGFVRALFENDDVRDVRVQKTALRRHATSNVVDFELAILLNGNGTGK